MGTESRKNVTMKTEQFEAEQAMIKKQGALNAYSVERDYVNSKEYRDKYEELPVNNRVKQSIYMQAIRLLNAVDGQEQERMIAINARTGALLVDNIERHDSGSIRGTGFNDEEYKIVKSCQDGVILLHSHSLNGRPSAQDIITYSQNSELKMSLIIAHDGSVYAIYFAKDVVESIYNEYFEEEKGKTGDEKEAKRIATTKMYLMNRKLGKRQRLFCVKELGGTEV